MIPSPYYPQSQPRHCFIANNGGGVGGGCNNNIIMDATVRRRRDEEATTWLRWMRSVPSPVLVDLSTEARRAADGIVSDDFLGLLNANANNDDNNKNSSSSSTKASNSSSSMSSSKMNRLRIEFLNRLQCQLILLQSGQGLRGDCGSQLDHFLPLPSYCVVVQHDIASFHPPPPLLLRAIVVVAAVTQQYHQRQRIDDLPVEPEIGESTQHGRTTTKSTSSPSKTTFTAIILSPCILLLHVIDTTRCCCIHPRAANLCILEHLMALLQRDADIYSEPLPRCDM